MTVSSGNNEFYYIWVITNTLHIYILRQLLRITSDIFCCNQIPLSGVNLDTLKMGKRVRTWAWKRMVTLHIHFHLYR